MFDSIFINGTVGAGKSTVAEAIGVLEEERGHPHAIIDLDYLRRLWPSSVGDTFNHELELANLAAVAANYRRAGAEHLILAGVLEEASEIARYRSALSSDGLLICRLEVDASVAAARLARRHDDHPADLRWHLERTGELAEILRRADLETLILDSSTRTPDDLASEIMSAAGW